jgi:hypothetical protein
MLQHEDGKYIEEKPPRLTPKESKAAYLYNRKKGVAYLCTASSSTKNKPCINTNHSFLLSHWSGVSSEQSWSVESNQSAMITVLCHAKEGAA